MFPPVPYPIPAPCCQLPVSVQAETVIREHEPRPGLPVSLTWGLAMCYVTGDWSTSTSDSLCGTAREGGGEGEGRGGGGEGAHTVAYKGGLS